MKPTANPPSDLEVNREIRRILVKHWIDLGRVAVRTANARVTLYGTLQSLPGTKEELRPETVKAIFEAIQRLHCVQRVVAKFDNWTQDGTLWKPYKSDTPSDVLDNL